jgi:hypothetical protein
MSLDALITGPGAGVGNPLGNGNGHLHAWMFEQKTDATLRFWRKRTTRPGAIIQGRRTRNPYFALADSSSASVTLAG